MPPPISHTFEVESTDHCETPLAAYADVAPILEQMALSLGKTKETVRIYDPYFCAGGVKKHLNKLGFTHVYNENEDFYKMIASKKTPKYVTKATDSQLPSPHSVLVVDVTCHVHACTVSIILQ
eukprot:m.101223 g.101223  ORF g.101223 m.101223 type:complete len:123 (-) comp10380_c0_seq2:1304-1672(-)